METDFYTELNKLVRKLDNRSKQATGKNVFLKKERIDKSSSLISPPSSAPRWAVCQCEGSAVEPVSTPSREENDSSIRRRLNPLSQESCSDTNVD